MDALGGDALPAFVPVSVDGEAEVSSAGASAPEGVVCIEIGSGVVVRVPRDVSVERAAALVRALRGAA
jgi:transposase